ncbi:hypothetical protein [Bacteroides sedimenti]|uniref:Uncharacterized protein n=1 Tax=Bacteroides sedimenti TaxID=2136147 RepID=A0ABM8IA04_9BACE
MSEANNVKRPEIAAPTETQKDWPHDRSKASKTEEDRPHFFLREEINRNGALKRSDCLSEASLSSFSEMQVDFSKKNAALTFWFFWVKPKEQKNELKIKN